MATAELAGILKPLSFVLLTLTASSLLVESGDTNGVYSPCSDTTVQVSDGFTFGIAFALRTAFFSNSSIQLSPCDRRLSLSNQNAQISVFRPKVDEISLLTINTSSFYPVSPLFPYGSFNSVNFASHFFVWRCRIGLDL